MRKMSKILKFIGVVLAVAASAVLVGFVGSKRSAAVCEEMQIYIHTQGSKNLLAESDIRNSISDNIGIVVGEPLQTIHTKSIEAELRSIPFVKAVKAYGTINKKLIVELEERNPLVRLIDKNGQSSLIDSDGYFMPVSQNVALRLPVITGDFEINKEIAATNTDVKDSLIDPVFSKMYDYAVTVWKNEFWKAQIQHTHIEQNGDFIAHPQVGNHTINFGPGNNIENKLNRLFVFYEKGISEAGWNKYSQVNLKYKDQIVCTKK